MTHALAKENVTHVFDVLYKVIHYQYLILSQVSFLKQLPDDKILDWSKLKQIADNILKCI